MARYKVASADITYQLLDGEVVAIHFTKGVYYSLRGAAAPAFDALARGVPFAKLHELFVAAPVDALTQLESLRAQLIEAGLLVEDQEGGTNAWPAIQPQPWSDPAFESYTDMQQLLLADPIHDVGDKAWPHVETTAKNAVAGT
jgi:hypothetical protein